MKRTVYQLFVCFVFLLPTSILHSQLTVTISGLPPACGGAADGILSAYATGGQAPYFYQWSTGDTGPVVSGVGAGNYLVTVTDMLGNSAIDQITFQDPPFLFVNLDSTYFCDGTGDLEASASGGSPPYQFAWSHGAFGPSQPSLPAGSYCVSIQDGNSCEKVLCATIPDELSVVVDATEVSCNDACDASVTAVPSGGTPPYTYLWDVGATSQSIFNIHLDSYTVTVTDADGCTASATGFVNGPDAIEITFTSDVLPCGQGITGCATASASGGNAPYNYFWSVSQGGATVCDLSPGITYYVTAVDINNCEATDSLVLEQETDLDLTIFSTDELCDIDQGGTAAVMASSGQPPYSYEWNTGATTQTILDLITGLYIVTVTDANGCMGVDTAVVGLSAFNIEVDVFTTDESFCQAGDGTAAVTVDGGTAPYTYIWSNGQSDSLLTDLAPGTYFVTVIDATDCPAYGVGTIESSDELLLNLLGDDLNCEGDASILVEVTSGNPPFQYLWNTGDTTAQIAGLTSGTYTVTVTNGAGCTGVDSLEINAFPFPELELNAIDIGCGGANDGSVFAIVSGVGSPFSFLWNTGDTTAVLNNLGAGTYIVTVTNSFGCAVEDSIALQDAPGIDLSITATDVTCAGVSDGTLTATASGGAPPLQYLWNTGDTTAMVSGLPGGLYTLTLTDNGGCELVESVQINEPDSIGIDFQTVPVSCDGVADGVISLSVFGGTAPFQYLWNTGDTLPDLQNLEAGIYEVTVTDANQCEQTGEVELLAPSAIELNISVVDVNCFGGSDGELSLLISGGTLPYSIEWNTGDTTATIGSLQAGAYSVTVSDASGCFAVENTSVNEPPALEVSITALEIPCEGDSNGMLQASATGGTPPYTYSWNVGMGDILSDLPGGIYQLTVTDANGCEAEESIELEEQTAPNISAEQISPTCFGGANGEANVEIITPTGDEVIEWSTGASTQTINGLAPGWYFVTVTDLSTTCLALDSVLIEELPAGVCNAYVVQEISSFDGMDGIVAVDPPATGTPPFTYDWDTGDQTAQVDNLGAGVYSVTVTDADGCQSVCSVELNNPAKLGDFVWLDTNQNGIQDPGETGVEDINVSLSGTDADGNAIQLSTTTDSNGNYLFDGLPAGTYQLTFFNLPTSDFEFTLSNVGNDDTDSDVDMNGTTGVISLSLGQCDLTVDAGIFTVCVNVTDPGEIEGDEYLCGPGLDPGPILEVTPPSGGVGQLEYLWMFNTDGGPFNPNTWTTIPNSNTPNYDPGPIFETTYFVRCVRRENCTLYLETDPVIKEVGDDAIAGISGPETVCVDDLVTFTADDAGPGAIYEWDFGPNSTPSTASTQVVDVTWDTYGVVTIQLTVTNNGCTAFAYLPIFVTDVVTLCPSAGPGQIQLGLQENNNGTLSLHWTTELPVENGTFVLEHSREGEQFAPVSQRAGSSADQTAEQTPQPGFNFYQIRYFGPETEEAVFSNVVRFDRFDAAQSVLLYPNPVSEQLFIQSKASTGPVVLSIYRPDGTQVYTVHLDSGSLKEVNMRSFASGIYWVRIQDEKGAIQSLKVVKE
jgi:hypothetical protein